MPPPLKPDPELLNETEGSGINETDYLLKYPANAAHLYESIETVKAGKAFVEVLSGDSADTVKKQGK